MSSFRALVKEEPMDVANLTMPHPMHPSDSQMQNLAQMTANIQPRATMRGEIDPNFEPVSRLRSNTWPLPCPEAFMENEESALPEVAGTSSDPPRPPGPNPPFGDAPGPQKKNTSRRNPWGNMSYADLIAQAIVSTSEGRATLSQIYDWMVQNVPYFKDKGDSNSSAGWKNSIRHNLSLHSRFMRMQNEGTGKSSWWVLNPEAKPGKSTRRRANTLEGGVGRLEKTKRNRSGRKKNESSGVLRNGLDNPVSPSDEGFYAVGSPAQGVIPHAYVQLSPSTAEFRQRADSNTSSCGGRLTPIPDPDMHDSQVPPMSPGPWGPEYWSTNAVHASQHPMRVSHHEHYADQLAESMGEHFSLHGGTRESWAPHLAMNPGGPHNIHHHHHMNGFVNHHPPHPHPNFGSYDDFPRFGSHGLHGAPKYFPSAAICDKSGPRSMHPFHIQPLQNVSPVHSLSPPNGVSDFSSDGDLRPQNPSFPSTQGSLNPQSSQIVATPVSIHSPLTSANSVGLNGSPPHLVDSRAGESTAMLRVALSHKEAPSPCAHSGVPQRLHHPGVGADLPDLDNFQGGLECNVEEVIKHELQYEENLNFDFQGHAAAAAAYAHHGHSFSSSHRDSAAANAGASSVYSCPPIQAGNQWVR